MLTGGSINCHLTQMCIRHLDTLCKHFFNEIGNGHHTKINVYTLAEVYSQLTKPVDILCNILQVKVGSVDTNYSPYMCAETVSGNKLVSPVVHSSPPFNTV